ncbi:MAG: hypothetical protein PWQ77_1948 [Kosmotogales bacterium]|nr:hypothetical protein [Kosmotogales bacterium]
MSNTQIIVFISVLFLATIATGIFLSVIGRPLNGPLFTVHKLVAIGMIVISIISYINLMKKAGGTESNIKLLLIFVGISLAIVLVTGALLSFDKFPVLPLKIIHGIGSGSTALLTTITIYKLIALQ